jgi:hypothetical protein
LSPEVSHRYYKSLTHLVILLKGKIKATPSRLPSEDSFITFLYAIYVVADSTNTEFLIDERIW